MAVVAFPLVFAGAGCVRGGQPTTGTGRPVLGLNELAVFFRITLLLAWRGILPGCWPLPAPWANSVPR